MTNNDVRRIYTQKVSELLAKGYQIHYETMSGSQGELAHIDLSDGNEILRVLLEREGNYGGSYGSIPAGRLRRRCRFQQRSCLYRREHPCRIHRRIHCRRHHR